MTDTYNTENSSRQVADYEAGRAQEAAYRAGVRDGSVEPESSSGGSGKSVFAVIFGVFLVIVGCVVLFSLGGNKSEAPTVSVPDKISISVPDIKVDVSLPSNNTGG